MNETVSVSVVIPAYNAESYIGEALDSVIGQTLPPTEVIVVDDGSVDGTRSIVFKSAEKAVFPIRLIEQRNRGPAAARNQGIKASVGNFVAFLDADDRWHRTKLEKQVTRLGKCEDCQLVYTDRQWVDGGGQPLQFPPPQSEWPEGNVFKKMILGNYLVTSSVLVCREALINVGFFDEGKQFSNCQDYHLWLRLSEIINFCAIPEKLIDYRVHAENRHKNISPRYSGMIGCIDYAFYSDYWTKESKSDYLWAFEDRYYAIHKSYAWTFFRLGSYDNALLAAKCALKWKKNETRMWALRFFLMLPNPLVSAIKSVKKALR